MHLAESSSSLFSLWTGLSLPVALHPVSRRRSCLQLRTDQCFCPMRTFTSLLVRTLRRTPLTPSACMVRSSFTVCRISNSAHLLPLTSHQSVLTAIRVWRYPALPALPAFSPRQQPSQRNAHCAISKVTLRNDRYWRPTPGFRQPFNRLHRHDSIVGSRDQPNFSAVKQRFSVKRRGKMRMLQRDSSFYSDLGEPRSDTAAGGTVPNRLLNIRNRLKQRDKFEIAFNEAK